MKSAIILSIKHGNFTALKNQYLISKPKQTANLGPLSQTSPPASCDVTGRRLAVREVSQRPVLDYKHGKHVRLMLAFSHCDRILLGYQYSVL